MSNDSTSKSAPGQAPLPPAPPAPPGSSGEDVVDGILRQWAMRRPDLDTSVMGVMGRLSRATRLVENGVAEYLAGVGMEPWEFDVLATLRRSGAPYMLSPKDLVATMMIKLPALTNRVDRLLARGLVTRHIDPDNRRRMLITLTPEGRELVDSAVPGHVANGEHLVCGLDADEQAQLAGLLRKLLLSLGDAPR